MDDDREQRALAVARPPPLVRAMLGAAVAMVAPPLVAGVVSGAALAVVVGMVSIFTGMVGMSLVVYQHEKWQRRDRPAPLPRARLLKPPSGPTS